MVMYVVNKDKFSTCLLFTLGPLEQLTQHRAGDCTVVAWLTLHFLYNHRT